MEISQPRYESSSLVSIQALRAIAALLVFWGHAINAVHQKIEADFPHLYGPFGVDLFFVISGFVMVYSSERLFGQPGAPITFFVRRLARIVPLYWLATAVLVWFVVPYASTKAVLGSCLPLHCLRSGVSQSLQKLIERPRSPMKSAIGIYSTNPHPSCVAGNEASGMRGLDVGSRNAGRSALRPDQALPQQAAGYSRKSTQPRFTSRSSRMHLCRSGCAGAHPERSR
ncbi:MAG: exopolysaccharide production protein ExoZ [Alphaproteobacteria bacterium]|nr:exopolysaccharide production protein ExoZ [Alphaproteobacteria bacterium]